MPLSRRMQVADKLKSTGSFTLAALGFALGMSFGKNPASKQSPFETDGADTPMSAAPEAHTAHPKSVHTPKSNNTPPEGILGGHDQSILLLEQILLSIQGLRTDIRRSTRDSGEALEDIREQQERDSERATSNTAPAATSTSPIPVRNQSNIDGKPVESKSLWSSLKDTIINSLALSSLAKKALPVLGTLGRVAAPFAATAVAAGTLIYGAKKLADNIQANPKSLWAKIDDVMTNDKYRIPIIADVGDAVGRVLAPIEHVLGIKTPDERHNRNIGAGPAMTSGLPSSVGQELPAPPSTPPALVSSNLNDNASLPSDNTPRLDITPDSTPAKVATSPQRVSKSAPAPNVADMHISKEGLQYLADREGLPKDGKPYWDVTGWAIGYGDHTYKGRPLGNDPTKPPNIKMTKEEAKAAFIKRIPDYERMVKQKLTKPIPQQQFDALVSVAWNLPKAAQNLAAKVNAGQQLTRQDFTRSGTVKGQPFQPLVARREQEFAQFQSMPVSTRAAGPVWKDTQQVTQDRAAAPVIMANNFGGDRTVIVNKTTPTPVPIRPRGDNRTVDAIQSMNTI